MRNDHFRLIARHRWLQSAFFAFGLAFAATTVLAQTVTPPNRAESGAPPAASSNPQPVEGVTVNGRRADTGAAIPDDKKAEYDAEAAREAAFREYRQSRPPLTTDDKGVSDPNDQSKDFPGLQSYLPK